jgi:exodeoxyribonuclease VII small subunit
MARESPKRSDDAPAASAAASTTPATPDDSATAAAKAVAGAAGEPGIDDILGRLERVVKDLEGGDLPLERALERFEIGVKLARRGNQLLDGIEEHVEMLLADRDEVVPLPRAQAPKTDDDDGG